MRPGLGALLRWPEAGLRLLRALLWALKGWWTIVFRFPGLAQAQREQQIQSWARQMLARLAIDVVVTGEPAAAAPVLLVSNHISWVDILALHTARYCRFVSKADVRRWPVVGALADGAGTLFIARESRRDAMRVVHHMAESLKGGAVLAVFPEGTTSDGLKVLPFHANLLQAAISANVAVQPVALRFVEAMTGAVSMAPCYLGQDRLIGSMWRTVSARGIVAVVAFGVPQTADGRSRREWAADLRAAVEQLRFQPLPQMHCAA